MRRTPRSCCFSYPLHPPGGPERTDARIAHWPAIRCPVLLLSGESDPFARIELLRASVGLLANAELVTYPRLGHTLKPVLDDVARPRRGVPRERCRYPDRDFWVVLPRRGDVGTLGHPPGAAAAVSLGRKTRPVAVGVPKPRPQPRFAPTDKPTLDALTASSR